MAAPMDPNHPEEWPLPQEERWRLWEQRTGRVRPALMLGNVMFRIEDKD